MNITPVGHRILVAPFKLQEHDKVFAAAQKAGIVLPEFSERKEQVNVDKGVVVAIGDTAFKDFGGEPWCKVGDTVGYVKFGGKFVQDPVTEELLLILNDEDVICVLRKANDE